MYTNERKPLPAQGSSELQDPAGKGGTVPAPCPLSSNRLPPVSGVGTGGKRATTPQEVVQRIDVLIEGFGPFLGKLGEVKGRLKKLARYLHNPDDLDEEEGPDSDIIGLEWYQELLRCVEGIIESLDVAHKGFLGDGRYMRHFRSDMAEWRDSCPVLTDRGSSPVRVMRVEVGIGPGPRIRSPPKRSVRSGTDPGPVK